MHNTITLQHDNTDMDNMGFLTDKRKEFLNTPIEERAKKYGNNKRVYDKIIRDKARESIKDLILVSCASDKKQNMEIFTPEEVANMLKCIVTKQGRDITGSGQYFHILMNAIISSINADLAQSEKKTIDYQIIEKPMVDYTYSSLDLTDKDRREESKKELRME